MYRRVIAGIAEEAIHALRELSKMGWPGFECSEENLEILSKWEKSDSDMPETLDNIRGDLGDCHRCRLAEERSNIVFGVGDPHATLAFVGEGPGSDEDRQGEPFVGRAGQKLTQIIQAMGLQREQVYICNIVKCRPPANRNPMPDEIAACSPFLERQLMAVQPDFICALGTFAAQTLLDVPTPISRLRGRFHDYIGISLMPTYHPAYLLRNPAKRRDVWEDVQKIMKGMGLNGKDG